MVCLAPRTGDCDEGVKLAILRSYPSLPDLCFGITSDASGGFPPESDVTYLEPRLRDRGFLSLFVYQRVPNQAASSALVGHDAPGKLRYGKSRPPVFRRDRKCGALSYLLSGFSGRVPGGRALSK